MTSIDVYRKDLLLTTIKPEDDSKLFKKIMGDNQLTINIVVNDPIDFQLSDKVQFFGEWYYLFDVPPATKLDTATFKYALIFQHSQAMLKRVQYLFLGDDNSLKEPDFALRGRPQAFINLMLQNLKRLEPDFYFTALEVYDAEEKTITFSNQDCLSALGVIAEAFSTEFTFIGTQILLTKKQTDKGYVFRNGKDKGLYEITKKSVDNTQLVTRIYPFGSDKNLPEFYRNGSKRLKMAPLPRPIASSVNVHRAAVSGQYQYTFTWTPPNVPGATGVRVTQKRYNPVTKNYGQWTNPQTLPLAGGVYTSPVNLSSMFRFETVLDGATIGQATGELFYPKFGYVLDGGTTPDQSDSPSLPLPVTEVLYLEKNVDKYGVWEQTVIFEDIYPHRTGTITAVNLANIYELTDSTIDFNLNAYLLPGMTAKITFNTGQLTGYIFEISKFDAVTKRITIVKNKDERALDIPNNSLKAAIGDTYVITDISLPVEYVDEAEQELKDAAQLYLNENCEPQLSFGMKTDPTEIKTRNWVLDLGDLVWLDDDDLKIKKKMRIISITREVVNEYAYDIEIADALTKSTLKALITGQANVTTTVNAIAQSIQNSAINNNRVINTMIITKQGDIQFEEIKQGAGLTALGIGTDGKIYKF